jgi:hypothetical protein
MSMSLYRVCCAATCIGSASAASNVIAVNDVNVLDFMAASDVKLLGGEVQRTLRSFATFSPYGVSRPGM